MTYKIQRPRFRRGRGKNIKAKINGPHNTRSKPPQQHTKNEARVERKSERKLSPYHFTVRNGGGVYLTNASTLKHARAELRDFFGAEFVSVERCPGVRAKNYCTSGPGHTLRNKGKKLLANRKTEDHSGTPAKGIPTILRSVDEGVLLESMVVGLVTFPSFFAMNILQHTLKWW